MPCLSFMVHGEYPSPSQMASFPEGLMSPEAESAEGGLVSDRRSRFADLKTMLEGSKDSVKVDAMKRIINLVARGKDMSELFPNVVKNVAAKNLELKKLVYVYLERYAEEQQDLALLSISTFQRGLKDPNQLIRASALRVLSSIRVGMISPIVLLAIKDGVRDMSPYVRKVAAHAIPKLYSLDSSLEGELVECIVLLLSDRRGLVLGSAVYALDQICPHRLDLLHAHFRAFCKALPDVDEWGQVVMLNLLTRYARTQLQSADILPMDDDVALLLSSVRPLLQSRNCAVVLAVTALVTHVGPPTALPSCAHALVRLLRGPREVQYIVLLNMATLAERARTMFDPFLKSFFLRSSDCLQVRQLKLHMMTALVNETNVHIMLRELRTYVSSSALAGDAIEAIGRCAVRVGSVSDSCLGGLVSLLASNDDDVVSSSVLVLKRLLHSEAPVKLLEKLARLLLSLKAPAARACVVWLVSTHLHKLLHMAPDLLRILAKNFSTEHESVKLETLKLAVALWIVKKEEVATLVQYVFQLARFDLSYDIRDRCRFLRVLLFKTQTLSSHAAEIFMEDKPAPSLSSAFAERHDLQLGTLSHVLNQTCTRYEPLPPWTENPTPASLRGVIEVPKEESEEEEEDEEEDEDEDEESGEEEEEDEESEEEEDESEETDDEDEDEEEEEESSEEEEEEEEAPPAPKKGAKKAPLLNNHPVKKETKRESAPPPPVAAPLDLLLDIDFSPSGMRAAATCPVQSEPRVLLSSVHGLSLSLSFPRSASASSTPLLFELANHESSTATAIRLKAPEGMTARGEMTIDSLTPGESLSLTVMVEAGDTGGAREWTLEAEGRQPRKIEVDLPLGEQLEAVRLSPEETEKEKAALTGMNAVQKSTKGKVSAAAVQRVANVYESVAGVLTGQTRARKDVVLVVLGDESGLQVCCGNALLAASLAFALQSHVDSI